MSTHDETTDSDEMVGREIIVPTKGVDPDATVEDRLTENVRHRIGPARYFEKDENGDPVESWAGTFDRVAGNIAEAELVHDGEQRHYRRWKQAFYDAMAELRFVPNSPTLMNAGLELQQLSACFVIEPKDSMDDINEKQTDAASIFKSGGGVGYAFHHLRPKGAIVASTGGVSSGPLSFMELYDVTCGTVKQGGKRRGAQMGIMHVHHPDVGRFAVSKRGEDRFTNFNISLGLTDNFMEAVREDEEFTLYSPQSREDENEDLRAGEPFEVVPETAHFYNPEFEDAWNDERDSPGVGLDGKLVDENFWRDYADDLEADVSEFRDRIDLEPGEPMTLPARFIWTLLIDGAWNNGEPGIFNLDETNRQHSFDGEEHPEHYIHATNPCSEQPLEQYEACNLGHVNLSLMVDDTAPTVEEFADRYDQMDDESLAQAYLNRALDDETFEETIRTGTRFLDNVVTMSEFPLDEITREVGRKRKIGLGLMGFHQMLMQMGIEYGSDLSYAVAREIMRRIDEQATEYSHQLAQERGVFDEWPDSKWADPQAHPEWFATHAHEDPSDWPEGYPVRNHNLTTIAPTGTTSMIGNTTGGCEPIPFVAYRKNVGNDIQGDTDLVEFDDFFLRTLEANGIDVEAVKEEAVTQMDNNEFDGVEGLETVPDAIGELFVTTNDLSGEQHVRMQGAFQEYCDSGISKTLNMPFDTDIEEVGEAFSLAYDLGIKGTTVYRNGSRNEQVIKQNAEEREFTEEERDEVLTGAKALVRKDEEALDELKAVIDAVTGGEN